MVNVLYRDTEFSAPRLPVTFTAQKFAYTNFHPVVEKLYFGEYEGVLKRWNGTSWVISKMRVNTGSFIDKPLKTFNGVSWDEVNKQ